MEPQGLLGHSIRGSPSTLRPRISPGLIILEDAPAAPHPRASQGRGFSARPAAAHPSRVWGRARGEGGVGGEGHRVPIGRSWAGRGRRGAGAPPPPGVWPVGPTRGHTVHGAVTQPRRGPCPPLGVRLLGAQTRTRARAASTVPVAPAAPKGPGSRPGARASPFGPRHAGRFRLGWRDVHVLGRTVLCSFPPFLVPMRRCRQLTDALEATVAVARHTPHALGTRVGASPLRNEVK